MILWFRFWIWGGLLALCCTVAVAAAPAPRPQLAPTAYVSSEYGLTFQPPAGSTYCALPHDAVGPDHGTVIFLSPPSACGGVGWPSSSRGFSPSDTPRIEVYYQYWMDVPLDDPVCHRLGHMRFLGAWRALCRSQSRGSRIVSVDGRYDVNPGDGGQGEAIFTLVTSKARFVDDLLAFKVMVRSARPCRSMFVDGPKAIQSTSGTGAACPPGDSF